MFGFGFSEVITLIIVVLILISPKDYPRLVRKIGKLYGQVVRQVNRAKKVYSEFEEEVKIATDMDITGEKPPRIKDKNQKIVGDKK